MCKVKMKTAITITIAILLTMTSLSFASKEVPFTLEDRDRLIRVEIKVESNEKRLESIDRRIERLENIMMWGFGLLFTTMIGLVGFVLWDRRSALAPAIRKNKELEERQDKFERVIKEVALKNSDMAEALKRVGL
jgi:hypothetical protein